MKSESVRAARRKFRKSTHHHPETTDRESNEVNNPYWNPLSEGSIKDTDDEGEYNHLVMF